MLTLHLLSLVNMFVPESVQSSAEGGSNQGEDGERVVPKLSSLTNSSTFRQVTRGGEQMQFWKGSHIDYLI